MTSKTRLTPKPGVPALVPTSLLRGSTVLGAAAIGAASLIGCGSTINPPMAMPSVPDVGSADAGPDAFIAPMPPPMDAGTDSAMAPMVDVGPAPEDAGTDAIIGPMPMPIDADVIAPMPPPMPPPPMPAP